MNSPTLNIMQKSLFSITLLLMVFTFELFAVQPDPYQPDSQSPTIYPSMKLMWSDEFNTEGKPNPAYWKYENGFVRNEELQWYQSDNAICANGTLILEAKRERKLNPNYVAGSTDWKKKRQYAEYTSSSIKSQGLVSYQFGRIEVRARIDVSKGSWPAIWTLGETGEWPSNGEVDIMEFYLKSGVPTILANVAWGTSTRWVAKWDSSTKPLSYFTGKDPNWVSKFHTWRMDWNKDSICLYLDNELLNYTLLNQTINATGVSPRNPFLQKHYFLLNLAIGSNGGDPSQTNFPIKYEVDYIRVYQPSITSDIASPDLNKSEVFPNPASDFIRVQHPENITSVEITDLSGRVMKNHSDSGGLNREALSLSGLKDGVYLLKVNAGDITEVSKLIVSK
jgi:beta-glucanase (GH16 family)